MSSASTSLVERVRGLDAMEVFRLLRVPIGILLIALLIRPVIGSDLLLGSPHIATTILIWMLFATAFNLLLGYTGLLSFGHAMFLGTGVYMTAIGLAYFDMPFSVMTVLAIVLAATIAYLIGRLTVQYGEIYFAMLTLAFGMMLHFFVNSNPGGLTGGSDGIRSGTTPEWITSLRGERVIDVDWFATLLGYLGLEPDYYWFVAIVFVVAMLGLWQIVRSPFGRTLVAIHDNQELASAMGIDIYRYKVWALTFSGAFSALAGALLMVNNHGASLENFGPMTSAEVLLMAIFGGIGFFFGPAVGAGAWYLVREYLLSLGTVTVPGVGALEVGGVLSYWQFFFGLAFVIVILASPRGGIYGFVRDRTLTALAFARRWRTDG
ncbi:branched-chain amino acid ABC transporter permease [Natrarchaeobaculum aegyptiacum]|uniref:Branched-chain amino acid ABC transporter permease n=1 Tax=Natrarchaeobaculum aegyptiacum TaxID=745377 RepID=A0A2Z2HR80_9EURY|nr:branched-chain amino acid ABC transporter permease [Natrarchaeobaculum aegyptiacum]ARS89542.1 branched-chain amino acid ABC transporter permease [Natrarchaeobaculum aegyptiacum]